jgi:hypothetical protein
VTATEALGGAAEIKALRAYRGSHGKIAPETVHRRTGARLLSVGDKLADRRSWRSPTGPYCSICRAGRLAIASGADRPADSRSARRRPSRAHRSRPASRRQQRLPPRPTFSKDSSYLFLILERRPAGRRRLAKDEIQRRRQTDHNSRNTMLITCQFFMNNCVWIGGVNKQITPPSTAPCRAPDLNGRRDCYDHRAYCCCDVPD